MVNSWSIRTRLTALAALVMFLISLAGVILLTTLLRGRVMELRIEAVGRSAIRVIHLAESGHVPKTIPKSGLENLEGLQVVDENGQVVGGTDGLGSAPRVSYLAPTEDNAFAFEQRCDLPGTGCKVITAYRVFREGDDWFIYAIDDPVPWFISGLYVLEMAGLMALVTGVTALGAHRTVGRALRPVEEIREQADEIAVGVAEGHGLGRRIALPEHNDELRALTKSANMLLARLEATIEREREFTSNASHDLRSPITAMRTELDEAMLFPDEADWPVTSEKLSASLDRLQELVTDLLTLSRLDAGAGAEKEPVDLAELVYAEMDRRQEDTRLRIDADSIEVMGVRPHLARMLTNLLDNAVRHAKHEIVVRVRGEGPHAYLEIYNDGDSIPAAKREVVFDRFTRLDASRSKDTGGSGLGLAICRQIARAHGGTIAVGDSDEGTKIVVRLPQRPRGVKSAR